MRNMLAMGLVMALAASANAGVVINEFLGSTTSGDTEFIELYNTGPGSVDISGWSIELWDSDSGTGFGGADGASPYVIPGSTALAAGDYYTFINDLAQPAFGVVGDQLIPNNAIENSSYTMILKDAGATTVESIFVTDGGAGDTANDAGTAIVPDFTLGPDGTFLPAGFYRVGDGNSTWALLEFSPIPAASATPDAQNLPEPASLALLALGGLFATRRRR